MLQIWNLEKHARNVYVGKKKKSSKTISWKLKRIPVRGFCKNTKSVRRDSLFAKWDIILQLLDKKFNVVYSRRASWQVSFKIKSCSSFMISAFLFKNTICPKNSQFWEWLSSFFTFMYNSEFWGDWREVSQSYSRTSSLNYPHLLFIICFLHFYTFQPVCD